MKNKTLVLDYAVWRCGGAVTFFDKKIGIGTGETRLLNEQGKQCCLGQWCLQFGLPREAIFDIGMPALLYEVHKPLLIDLLIDNADHKTNSAFSSDAIRINDDTKLPIELKVVLLRELCNFHGYGLIIKKCPRVMEKVAKYDQLTPAMKQEMQRLGIDDLRVGDVFIKVDGQYHCDIIRVIGFERKGKNGVYVQYQVAVNWEATEWGDNSDEKESNKFERTSLSQFKEYWTNDRRTSKLERGKTLKEYFEEAANIMTGKTSLTAYEATLLGEVSEERALMHKGSKEALIAMQQDLEARRSKVEVLKAFVGYEMERRHQELEKVQERMQEIMADFQKKITKIMKVITTIELYLGIDEELFQIQAGPKASATEPIQFRQAVLYMDEEIGHWESGGLDYTNITWFDEWLVKDSNYKKLLPEQKGMAVFRPRRNDKNYESNSWLEDAQKMH